MELQNIEIEGLGGVKSFSSSFDPRFNILCGPNGVGKTTILQVISKAFSANSEFLRRNQTSSKGRAAMSFVVGAANVKAEYSLSRFEPNQNEHIGGNADYARDVIFITTQRDFEYSQLETIRRDPSEHDILMRSHRQTTWQPVEIKQWFANRFVFSHLGKSLTENKKANLSFAFNVFEKIDDKYQFDTVDSSSFEIYVTTPTGRIPFEYLSSGFRSCLSLILGLIKEIEYRKSSADILIENFDGVVLIDEIDMHLHPAWQQKIVKILKDCFPKVQFIVTTHSPFVIQSASPNEILVLRHSETGGLARDKKIATDVGFAGWTIEEIAHDVLGVLEMRTSVFQDAFTRFQKAILGGALSDAEAAYLSLDQMLHPQNVSRQLLRAQLDTLKMDVEDEEDEE